MDDAAINQADLWQRARHGFPLFSDYVPATQRLASKGFRSRCLLRSIELPPRLPPSAWWLWQQGAEFTRRM